MDNPQEAGERTLLDWAQRLCPDSPRTRLKQWIADGRFSLDGEIVTQAGMRLPDPGARLCIGEADSAAASWSQPRKIDPKVTVLHLDPALAIVDKGAGLLSLPVADQPGKSALQVLGDFLNDPRGDGLRRRLFGRQGTARPLPVHRLDQYTSGLLCLALGEQARNSLIEQLRTGDLLREYIAFADGLPAQSAGTWRHWLKLDAAGYRQQLFTEPVDGATEAVTHFALEQVFDRHRVCRLRIRLETGLKHQIRIQAAAVGLPLIGDRLYHPGTRKAVSIKGAPLPYGFRRQALHACLIGLRHPDSGKALRFESRLPGDLAGLQARLD